MSHTEATIKELEHRLVKVQALQVKIQEAIALLRDLGGMPIEEETTQFGPLGPVDGIIPGSVEVDGLPAVVFSSIGVTPRDQPSHLRKRSYLRNELLDNLPMMPDVSAAKKSKVGLRKNPASQYTGVTKYPPDRWKGLASISGKAEWCGVHEVEELSAAAVQEKLGNPELAQRLRDLAEQKKNKAEEAQPETQPQQESQTLGWDCNRCGHRHTQESKPERCECMATSFTRILPSGKGASDHVVTERGPDAEATSPFTLQADEVAE